LLLRPRPVLLGDQGRAAHTHTRFSGTTQVSRYQKGKTNVDFIEARDNNNNDRLTAFDPGQPG